MPYRVSRKHGVKGRVRPVAKTLNKDNIILQFNSSVTLGAIESLTFVVNKMPSLRRHYFRFCISVLKDPSLKTNFIRMAGNIQSARKNLTEVRLLTGVKSLEYATAKARLNSEIGELRVLIEHNL